MQNLKVQNYKKPHILTKNLIGVNLISGVTIEKTKNGKIEVTKPSFSIDASASANYLWKFGVSAGAALLTKLGGNMNFDKPKMALLPPQLQLKMQKYFNK